MAEDVDSPVRPPLGERGVAASLSRPDGREVIMVEATGHANRRRKEREALWRIRRIRRRIEKGYYDRPEVRAKIVDALLDAFLGHGPRRVQ